jgi:hypothetical protein
MDVSMRM